MFNAFKNRLARILAGLFVGAVMIGSVAHADGTTLQLPQKSEDPVAIALPDGLEGDPSDILQVFVGDVDQCCDNKVPVAGRYEFDDSILSFAPAFGFSAGQNYVASVHSAHGAVQIPFQLASDIATVPAAVTEIYPSGETLPENILRFYIHFSIPMRSGVAFDYIKLRNASGSADDAAFMRFKQELWNEDRTRLTILLDPGRIKRGVATNVELGTALLAGRRYTLDVDSGWSSADGASILPAFSKIFLVTDPLRTRPDTGLWQSNSPCVGKREAVEVTLDRPFDRHLLISKLRVLAETGHQIEGEIEIGNDERTWRFLPNQPWFGTVLKLAAETSLEDVAGNNFVDLLDHISSDEVAVAATSDLDIELTNCSD